MSTSRDVTATKATSTTPWRAWGCNDRSPRPSAALRLRSRWFVPQIGSSASTNDTPALCMPACTVSRCPCPSRLSRFPCSGTRVGMAIQHTAGCGGAFGASAPSSLRRRSARQPIPAARHLIPDTAAQQPLATYMVDHDHPLARHQVLRAPGRPRGAWSASA